MLTNSELSAMSAIPGVEIPVVSEELLDFRVVLATNIGKGKQVGERRRAAGCALVWGNILENDRPM